jgi:DNA topoisomerase-1
VPARKKQPADAPADTPKGRKKKAPAADAVTKTPAPRKTAARKTAGTGAGTGPDLVIVESPKKAVTIGKYLGSAYRVLASKGHVRDLPKRKKKGEKVAGVDIDSGWKATYVVIEEYGKKQALEELAREAKKAGRVFLATDPDREGEAIAWHLADALNLADETTYRIKFNEITRTAIQNAMADAGKIDMDRVRAQEARRILDRVVGFPLSGLVSRKVKPRSSAGRVQSVALKLVVDREREIEAFKTQEYWKMTALLAPQGTLKFEAKPFAVVMAKKKGEKGDRGEKEEKEEKAAAPKIPEGAFLAELAQWNGKKFEVGNEEAGSEASARAIATLLDSARYEIVKIEQKDRQERAQAPFTTSTLQQQASTRLHYATDRTMRIAQRLYEGVPLGSEGTVALITYMRTDSTKVSNDALQAVRAHIEATYGEKYLPAKPNYYESGKSAQEAHEAIRPTDLGYTPERAGRLGLHGDDLRLYTLIYNRFVASQMSPAVFAVTNVEIVATPTSGTATGLLRTTGRIQKFDGYRRVMPTTGRQEDAILPPLSERQRLDKLELTASQHFTQPPPRYNDSSLVRALEKEGIGRPSTYAKIISTITDEERGYIEVIDRRFHATEVGKAVTDLLIKHFPDVMSTQFTSHFEEELDQVETGKMKYEAVLTEFWGPFLDALNKADQDAQRGEETGEPCPKCGKPLVKKLSRKTNKFFVGCSDWKECKYIQPREGEEERAAPVETEFTCPTCGKKMMQLTGKAGPFLRCAGYPECQTKMNFGPDGQPVIAAQATEHACPKCGKPMLLREWQGKRFLGCSGYPKCRQTMEVDAEGNPIRPTDLGVVCDKCGGPMLVRKGFRGAFLGCSNYPKCRGTKQLTDELKEKLKDQLPAAPPKKEMPKIEIKEPCPDCGSPMRLQQNKRKGNYFLGCTKYPKCKGTREPSPETLEQLKVAEEQAAPAG